MSPLLAVVLALVLGGLTAPLAVSGPRTAFPGAARGPRAASCGRPRPARRGARCWLGGAAGLVVVAAPPHVGPGEVVGAAALAVAVGTVPGSCCCTPSTGAAGPAEVARACGVLASYVRVGQVPAEALVLVAPDRPVLSEAAAVQQIGGDVPAVLRAAGGAARPRRAGRPRAAWRCRPRPALRWRPRSTRWPSGLASNELPALGGVRGAQRTAVDGQGDGGRSRWSGIGLGYLLGGRPVRVAHGRARSAGPACCLGLGLAAAGVLWIERLARAAAAGRVR